MAGIAESDLGSKVYTGYGREFLGDDGAAVTEITCHARGAHHLDPAVRTVIDIGGQDSKVIRLSESGAVETFAMNDKCAAGTGRFLEMMARTLQMKLPEMSELGLDWHNDVTISSMCTVFAESEVVSLIARSTAPADIIHGLNKSVAGKTAALARRTGGVAPFMMTGGVARQPRRCERAGNRPESPGGGQRVQPTVRQPGRSAVCAGKNGREAVKPPVRKVLALSRTFVYTRVYHIKIA